MNTVKINKQEWLEQNLNIDHFRNGDTIIQASTKEAWKKAAESGTPAWCYYGYKAENGYCRDQLLKQLSRQSCVLFPATCHSRGRYQQAKNQTI